jgi:hypothetical protein
MVSSERRCGSRCGGWRPPRAPCPVRVRQFRGRRVGRRTGACGRPVAWSCLRRSRSRSTRRRARGHDRDRPRPSPRSRRRRPSEHRPCLRARCSSSGPTAGPARLVPARRAGGAGSGSREGRCAAARPGTCWRSATQERGEVTVRSSSATRCPCGLQRLRLLVANLVGPGRWHAATVAKLCRNPYVLRVAQESSR